MGDIADYYRDQAFDMMWEYDGIEIDAKNEREQLMVLEDRLDKGLWTSKDGNTTYVSELSCSHLNNIIKLLKRQPLTINFQEEWLQALLTHQAGKTVNIKSIKKICGTNETVIQVYKPEDKNILLII
tara:strand:- start:345 stop:725 length:381 start_codon:yes stop_codon:yes gene_type:complete